MKLIRLIVIIFICNSLLQLIIPFWWLLAPVCFLTCWLLAKSNREAFFSAFIGVGLSYFIMMLVQDYPTQFVLSEKMSAVFSLPGPIGFYLVSILVGGIIGGLSGLSGFVGKNFLRSTKSPA